MHLALWHNGGQLALLLFDCAPAALVRGRCYRALRRALSRNPQRYRVKDAAKPFTRGQWRERGLAGPQTDLVIEGFPGSANSFASNAVREAVDRPARIESHFHYTAQLRRARAFKVPTVVLIRPPRAACDSLKSKTPQTWDWLIAARWLLYHRYVLRHRAAFTTVAFCDAIDDVDNLRRRVPAIARLASRPLVGDTDFQRPSLHRVPIDASRPLLRWFLGRADKLHDRLIEGEAR